MAKFANFFVNKPKNQDANPGKQAQKNYPHIILKGEEEDVKYVSDLIEKLYANPALHTFNLPIERELHAGMVIEL